MLSLAFPSGSMVKNTPANTGDSGLIPEVGRFPGEVNGNPLQYSFLENPMDGGAWWATVIYTQSPEFTIFIIISIQYRNVKYMHCCSTNLRDFFILQNEISVHRKQQLPIFPSPPALANTILLFL